MKEEMLRVILKAKEMGWITVNPNLTDEALADVFVEVLKDMTVKKFIDIFNPDF